MPNSRIHRLVLTQHRQEVRSALREVKKALKRCPNVAKSRDESGNLPLHNAARAGVPCLQIVTALITAHADGLRTENCDGNYPLHVALTMANRTDDADLADLVRVLVEKSPRSVGHRNKNDLSALDLALHRYVSIDILKILVENQDPKNILDLDRQGFSCVLRLLDQRVEEEQEVNGTIEKLRVLVGAYKNKSLLEKRDRYGFHALHYAVRINQNPLLVKFLCECHPKLAGLASKEGILPIHSALPIPSAVGESRHHTVEILQILVHTYPKALFQSLNGARPLQVLKQYMEQNTAFAQCMCAYHLEEVALAQCTCAYLEEAETKWIQTCAHCRIRRYELFELGRKLRACSCCSHKTLYCGEVCQRMDWPKHRRMVGSEKKV